MQRDELRSSRGDRVVAVARRRRVVLLALFERDEEPVAVRCGIPERAFALGEGLVECEPAEGGEDFVAAVAGSEDGWDLVPQTKILIPQSGLKRIGGDTSGTSENRARSFLS